MGISFKSSTLLYCDNKSVIQIAHYSVFHVYEEYWGRLSFRPATSSVVHYWSAVCFILAAVGWFFFTKTHITACFCFLLGKLAMISAVTSWVWGGKVVCSIRVFLSLIYFVFLLGLPFNSRVVCSFYLLIYMEGHCIPFFRLASFSLLCNIMSLLYGF